MNTPPNDDSDLRRLLGDAVSDVHPDEGTEQIRARAHRPSVARWVPLTVAAAVATVLVIGGVGWLGRQSDDPPAASPGAPDASASSSPNKADAGRTVRVPVYYVGTTPAGPRLFTETHTVEDFAGSNLDAAVWEAFGARPLDPDYDAWGLADGIDVRTSSDGTTLTVDLSAPVARPAGMDDEAANVALQAVVWTADAIAKTSMPVRFTVDGQPAPQVLGIDTSSPIERASADSVLSTVSIDGPIEGATVPSPFQVTGHAATFEANVVWELKRGDQVVRHGFTTAQECCTLSPYTFTVTATPGDYTLVVHDTDESDGEGIGTSEDTKNITVE
jgi:hypothetical protein